MAQAQRVTHLVHDGFLDVVLHELARDRAVGVEFATRFQHIHRVAHLLCGQQAVDAACRLGRHAAFGVGRHEGVDEGLGKRERRRAFADGLRANDLGAEVAYRARHHAFERDVGVQDLTRARVNVTGADGGKGRVGVHHPAHRGVTVVQGVELGVVGLLLDLDGIGEADLLESAVPFQDRGPHTFAVSQRHVAVDPEGDGLDRLGHRSRRVLFLQAPAVDQALAWCAWQVAGEVQHRGREQAQPRVGAARFHRRVGQRRKREVQPHQQAARVGQEARHLRHRGPGWRAEATHGHAAGVEVVLGFDDGGQVGPAHLGDDGVAAVQAVALPQATLQHHAHAQDVGQEEVVGLHQHALAVRVRLAGHGRGPQQAVRVAGRHGARLGRAGCGHDIGVARLQPHLVVHAHELHHLRAAGTVDRHGHQAAQNPGLADAALDLGRQQIGLAELRWRQLDPDLVLLLPQRQRAVDAARFADDHGKRRHGRWRGGRACRACWTGRWCE